MSDKKQLRRLFRPWLRWLPVRLLALILERALHQPRLERSRL